MSRNMSPCCVDNAAQIDTREIVLDQLLAELAFHERAGGNHPDKPSRPTIVTGNGKVEESLRERHAERVLAVAGRPAGAVATVERRVLDRDVRRVADDRVILPVEDRVEPGGVL